VNQAQRDNEQLREGKSMLLDVIKRSGVEIKRLNDLVANGGAAPTVTTTPAFVDADYSCIMEDVDKVQGTAFA
jgi:hypothetical protein